MPLPPLPPRDQLAELCRLAGAREELEPQLVEKDFYLTRLLWALGDELGEGLLLKGGTLLSKVDVGFFRMSEDADFTIPFAQSRQKSLNVSRTNRVRGALKQIGAAVGLRPSFPSGSLSEKGSHVIWELDYPSEFGKQGFSLEVSTHPAFRPPRLVRLGQILEHPLIGDYRRATCWALDADESRAEKVRAAFSRTAIRDYYDLDRLLDGGADLSSRSFIALVDAKLAEVKQKPLRDQPMPFALDEARRLRLEASLRKDLPAVLRKGAPPFALHAMLARFERLWRRK
jgi:predicted nucleotidyltransferase component of viral defense system